MRRSKGDSLAMRQTLIVRSLKESTFDLAQNWKNHFNWGHDQVSQVRISTAFLIQQWNIF